jgi:hypothetical protein
MGYKMDSDIEYERAIYLYDLCQQGIISDLILDKACLKTLLIKGTKIAKHALRPRKATIGDITYTPDFAYTYNGAMVVEDVKGMYGDTKRNRRLKRVGKPIITEASRLRIRIYQIQHPHIIFRVVTIPTLDPDETARYFYF